MSVFERPFSKSREQRIGRKSRKEEAKKRKEKKLRKRKEQQKRDGFLRRENLEKGARKRERKSGETRDL